MAGLRRSGRIVKEVSIIVVGTDVGGKVFSEQSKTVLLSRHGAGILSRHKIAPEEILTLRLVTEDRVAVIRLVGPMGNRPDGYIYGVAFCDPALDFWRREFPDPSAAPNPILVEAVTFQCTICHERELVQQTDIEVDVFAVNESILRQCQSCGITTNWIHAKPDAPISSPLFDRPSLLFRLPPGKPANDPRLLSSAANAAIPEPGATPSFYSFAPPALTLVTSVAVLEPEPAPPPSIALPTGKKNRRQHLRATVAFTACIRHSSTGDEIVECDNISKGGFCFRSRRQYLEESTIEAAVPFTPGWAPIFVLAQIKRVEILPSGTLFKYGVAYLKPPSSFSRS